MIPYIATWRRMLPAASICLLIQTGAVEGEVVWEATRDKEITTAYQECPSQISGSAAQLRVGFDIGGGKNSPNLQYRGLLQYDLSTGTVPLDPSRIIHAASLDIYAGSVTLATDPSVAISARRLVSDTTEEPTTIDWAEADATWKNSTCVPNAVAWESPGGPSGSTASTISIPAAAQSYTIDLTELLKETLVDPAYDGRFDLMLRVESGTNDRFASIATSENANTSRRPKLRVFSCGDGVIDVQYGEQCEDGNSTIGDGCAPTCRFDGCGDGLIAPGEECDDRNTMDGDGCTGTCTLELPSDCTAVAVSEYLADYGGNPYFEWAIELAEVKFGLEPIPVVAVRCVIDRQRESATSTVLVPATEMYFALLTVADNSRGAILTSRPDVPDPFGSTLTLITDPRTATTFFMGGGIQVSRSATGALTGSLETESTLLGDHNSGGGAGADQCHDGADNFFQCVSRAYESNTACKLGTACLVSDLALNAIGLYLAPAGTWAKVFSGTTATATLGCFVASQFGPFAGSCGGLESALNDCSSEHPIPPACSTTDCMQASCVAHPGDAGSLWECAADVPSNSLCDPTCEACDGNGSCVPAVTCAGPCEICSNGACGDIRTATDIAVRARVIQRQEHCANSGGSCAGNNGCRPHVHVSAEWLNCTGNRLALCSGTAPEGPINWYCGNRCIESEDGTFYGVGACSTIGPLNDVMLEINECASDLNLRVLPNGSSPAAGQSVSLVPIDLTACCP